MYMDRAILPQSHGGITPYTGVKPPNVLLQNFVKKSYAEHKLIKTLYVLSSRLIAL
jgi:hypothetical protein